jgi:hypothetical protein
MAQEHRPAVWALPARAVRILARPVRSGGGYLMAALVVAGCSANVDDGHDAASSSVVAPELDELAELDLVIGNDRVGRALHAHPSTIPFKLDAVESLFEIGRACPRTDTKEIWVAEEKSSRLTGSQVLTNDLSPRLVVGGCNRHPSDPSAVRESFELFLAVVSDPARALEDPLSTTTVEAMALDDTTGLFNFYVLEPPAKAGATGTVTRFVRRADDVVEKWQKVAGRAATKDVNADRKCFNCHVHGDPIMNELTEPWTNWVSSHKQFSRPLASTSRELVSESRPFAGEHRRSSLANQLEQVMRASLAMWIEGVPGRPASGLGPQTLAGAQPGGVHGLLRSVFCETTVNYASVFDTVPIGLFVDESAANLAGLEPSIAPTGLGWTLLPVRAEVDLRIERYLQKAKVLRPDTVLAVRLLDDTHDVFSPKRCALHSALKARLTPDSSVDAAVRTTVLEALSSNAGITTAQRDFIRALVDLDVGSDDRDTAESAYIADLGTRFADETAKLETAEGRREIQRRWLDRQASARALFATAANPLPITLSPSPPPSSAALRE